MPPAVPDAPVREPEVEPDVVPEERPGRRAEPDPFNPYWPEDFPEPQPKA